MLYESDVISSVCNFLEEQKYKINQKLNEFEKGEDIIAISCDGLKCFIEAKGETSSKKTSARYGKSFSSSQVIDHIAKALFKAMQMKEIKEKGGEPCQVGIALPHNPEHRKNIITIESTLNRLEIEVFWVDADKHVTVNGNWKNS